MNGAEAQQSQVSTYLQWISLECFHCLKLINSTNIYEAECLTYVNGTAKLAVTLWFFCSRQRIKHSLSLGSNTHPTWFFWFCIGNHIGRTVRSSLNFIVGTHLEISIYCWKLQWKCERENVDKDNLSKRFEIAQNRGAFKNMSMKCLVNIFEWWRQRHRRAWTLLWICIRLRDEQICMHWICDKNQNWRCYH